MFPQPFVHSICNLNVILLHKEHVSIPPDSVPAQVCMLDINSNLLKVFDCAVIVWRMKGCFASNDKFRYMGQICQLLCRGLLHNTLVVVGIDRGLDDRLEVPCIVAYRRLVLNRKVGETKSESNIVSERRTKCEGWARRLQLNDTLNKIWAHIPDSPACRVVSTVRIRPIDPEYHMLPLASG
jgi:hypothetical protein